MEGNPRVVQGILSFLTGSPHGDTASSSSDSSVAQSLPINVQSLPVSSNDKKSSGQNLIEEVLCNLTESMVYLPSSSNIETNRKLWDNYAKCWKPEEKWYELT